jgi:hypothetical protein
MASKETLKDEFGDFLRLIPKNLISAPVAKVYAKATRNLDRLLFLDEYGELSVDRESLIALVRDKDLVSAKIADVVLLETAKHLGRRLKVRKDGIQVTWLEATKYGLPIVPMSRAAIQELTDSRFSTPNDIEKFIRRSLPDVPKFWSRSDCKAIQSDLIEGMLRNRTYWDCLVAHLGFWAALVLIGSHIVLISLLAVSWQVALAWAIVYSGVATAYVLLQCAANPNWN